MKTAKPPNMATQFVPPAKAAFWKLRGVFKWKSVAPYVKGVTVQFDPIDSTVGGLRLGCASSRGLCTLGLRAIVFPSCREFYRQTTSPKVRKENPKYEFKLQLVEGLEAPWVKVAFGVCAPGHSTP